MQSWFCNGMVYMLEPLLEFFYRVVKSDARNLAVCLHNKHDEY